jgi:predicted GIY-YIG superfamily endonuclease
LLSLYRRYCLIGVRDQWFIDSISLSDFSIPYDFDDASSQAPKVAGVYILRMRDGLKFKRIVGETDIVYIGSSSNLKRRIYQYNHPGPTQYTNRRVNNFVNVLCHQLEFMWKTVGDDNQIITEHNLLRKYQNEHHEFPPLNGSDIRNLKLNLKDEFVVEDEFHRQVTSKKTPD